MSSGNGASGTKRRRGRPSKLTPAVQARILKNLSVCGYLETAAMAAGIDEDTIHNWLRKGTADPAGEYGAFARAVKRARARREVQTLERVRKGGPQWQAQAWLLERMNPTKFSARVQQALREHDERLFEVLRDELEPDLYDRVVAIIARASRQERSAPAGT